MRPHTTTRSVAFLLAATAVACVGVGYERPHDTFMNGIRDLCGQAFEGRVTANEPAAPDDPFVGPRLVMHVRDCDGSATTRIPFHVGDDRSRTWVLTWSDKGVRLKHDHRHADGTPDVLTMYGGDTTGPGTGTRQEFPADAESKALFEREGRAVSNANIWAMEIEPGGRFVYELARPGRLFRVEFDLTRPVAAPPAPWGAAGTRPPSWNSSPDAAGAWTPWPSEG